MANAKKKHYVLIKLQSDRLLWLEARRDNGKTLLANGGTHPLDAESRAEALAGAVDELLDRVNISWFSSCEVVLVAPNNRLTARFMETPPTEEENVRDLVSFEVAETLQLPSDQIAWDFHRSSQHGEAQEKKLLWVSARKENIHTFLKLLPEDRLQPSQVTTDFWAAYEFILHEHKDLLHEPALIALQDSDQATVMIADSQAVYFMRSITTRRHGEGNGSAQESLVAHEIRRTLSYVSDQIPAGSIRRMILCGLSPEQKQSLHPVAEEMALDMVHVDVDDVKKRMLLEPNTRLTQEHFALSCLAYGYLNLDKDGIALLDEEEENNVWKTMLKKESMPPQQVMRRAGALAALILLVWVAQSLWFNNAAASYIDEGQELLRVADRLQKEEIALRQLTKTHVNYDDMFLFLAEKLPNGIFIKNISIDGQSNVDLVLTGGGHQQVQQIVNDLNAGKFFKEFIESRAGNESDGFTVYLKGKLR